MKDPRLTHNEAAALHAAAVTRDYSVHPRLGIFKSFCHLQTTEQSLESTVLW
jgi:hypothetical protein